MDTPIVDRKRTAVDPTWPYERTVSSLGRSHVLFAKCELEMERFISMEYEKSAEGIVGNFFFTEGPNKLNQCSVKYTFRS
jgi:hypothetical protein